MAHAVAALASLGDRIAKVLPTGDSAPAFEATAAEGFVLEMEGVDGEGSALADQLSRSSEPASLTEVLESATRQIRPFDAAIGGRAQGYLWDRDDAATQHWYPQGITGSQDAQASGPLAGREVHVVSWYSKRGHGVRLSFVDVAGGRYRHVLCVRPTGGEGSALVNVHAGGVVWVGDLVYVADTRRGLRVFDTSRMLRVPEHRREATQGHEYVVPQVGAYRSTGAKLNFSFASLDRSEPATLMVGEYSKAPGGRLVRWPIDLSSCLLSSRSAIEAYRAPVDRLQGATMVAGSLVASSSRMGGRLYVGRPGEPSRRHVWWPFLPEDLYFSGAAGELYSLTEEPGMRMVFGVAITELGL